MSTSNSTNLSRMQDGISEAFSDRQDFVVLQTIFTVLQTSRR